MNRSVAALLLVPFLAHCVAPDGPGGGRTLDLEVRWGLITNFAGDGHRAQFTIRNNSPLELTSANWEMYWNMSPRGIKSGSVTAPVTIEWINGDFYVMKPAPDFRLSPGEEVEVLYEGSGPVIKESDAPLGLYSVVYDADGSYALHPVPVYSIAPFTTPEQIHRGEGDREPIPTPEWLYEQHASISALPEDQVQLIVPQPRSMRLRDGHFIIDATVSIHYDPGLRSEAELLAAFLTGVLAEPLTAEEGVSSSNKGIHLRISDVDLPGSYSLTISPSDGVVIAGDHTGVFYGSQSLKALIPIVQLGQANDSIALRALVIRDTPAFAYRGMHLDVGRNFHSVESVKHLLDAMAFYKLNKLHVNLTEDEGWRIEVEALPELTQVGAFRGHTTDDAEHLQPSYGSGPFPDPTIGHGSGFYTREQYVEILRYALERHIEVIPEVNVPGHARAAVKAMEHRYRRLMAEGREADAERYRLVDPDDASEYRSAQWYTDNVISVCRESSYRFLTTVIDELIAMHEEAGAPLTMFHTGGDEVPAGAWTGSPICRAYLEEHPEIENPRNLQRAYFDRINAYLASKGLQTGGWEEVAMNFRSDGSWIPNPEFTDRDVVPYIWNSLWGAEDLGNRLANAGYPVVLCNVTNFYFDLAYNKDPREPGLYWGGFINTRDAFEFVPYDVFKSIKSRPDGTPYTDADFVGKETLAAAGRSNVLGLQAQLWSETLKGQAMLEYYYLPKMLGLAERAWYGQAAWGDIPGRDDRNAAIATAWNTFANALGTREFPRLDRLYGGYNYRLAPPGARVVNGRLAVNTAYPGMVVRYTTDGSDPTAESTLYSEPVEIGSTVVKLSTFDSRGRSSLPTIVDRR